MRKNATRLFALLMTLCMLVGIVPMQLIAADIAKAADTSSETTYVFAGSDFQAKGGHTSSQTIVNDILTQMKNDYPTMDGFLFAGDYDVDMNYSNQTSDTEGGKKALQQTVQNFYGTDMDEIYVQGNHDNDSTADGTLCSNSGKNDPESGKYGVFVINEKDYMWSDQSSKGSTVKATAESLEAYLDEKIEAGFTKPIFVMSHLPLHYSMRTKRDSDCMYANYIFDVLNAAGASGLNIIFMFGHNHSHGWDDYLGGASIFLTKGDSINIAQASQNDFNKETLNFTYMNAGYTGYYGETGSGVDSTLTMTAFEITDNSVKISRYSADGTHVLKAEGAYGCSYGMQKNNVGDSYSAAYDEAANNYYSADTSSLNSPCEVMLDKSLSAGNSNGNLGNSDAGTDDTTPTVKEENKGWVMITEKVDASTKYVATTSIESGEKYVIVGSDYDYAMMKSGSGVKATPVTISGDTLTYNGTGSSNSIEWEFSSASSGTIKSADSSDRYLYLTIGNSLSLSYSATNLTIKNSSENNFQIYSSVTSNKPMGGNWTETYYLYLRRMGGGYYGSSYNFNASTSSKTVRLYKKVVTEAQDGLYVIANGELVYDVVRGTSADDALAAVKAGLKVYSNTTKSENGWQDVSDTEKVTYELDSSYSGTAAGEYAVTVKYDGHTLAIAKVVVPKADIESLTVVNREGTVKKGATAAADTGAKLRVNYEDGTSEDVPITVAMLRDGNDNNPSTAEITTIAGLSVKYKGKTADGSFTLYVVGKVGNNYPDYPDEGSVNVNKTAKGDQFTSTGVAKVELSASGIPSEKGADVIVMLDLSGSMDDKIASGSSTKRLDVLKSSLKKMIAEFQTPGDDGKSPDIRIAVADFHRYYESSDSPYYINEDDHLNGGSIRTGTESYTNLVYTGSKGTLDADAFVDVNTITSTSWIDNMEKNSGTNYDYAFDAVYQLGAAITAKNEEDNVERDLFVIFMSDGAPFQYNYFASQSGTEGGNTPARYWNNWLTGTMEGSMFDSGARNDYYNDEGKHWMAEAIKGDTDKTYSVIRKNDSRDTDNDNWIKVAGLGAKMYSIGFCLAVDKEITVDTMNTVIRNIATSSEFYFTADSADELSKTFSQITSDILYAAQNARFVDTMGDAFDLQMSKVTKGASDSVTPITPEITVKSYDIYTTADNVSKNLIGTRKGTYTTLEKVTFNDDGTEAYSDQIGGGKTNILVDGVICAKYFYYNTNKTAVIIDGISIPTSKRGGLTSGSTTSLPAETFYWNLGTVKSSELVLSYYVYLTGSVDGTRDAGSYATNSSATLYYDNYLENPCFKETVSPVMPWGEAHVRYAFYLVDSKGDIVVNETTGKTGSFANRIAVTTPVIAQTFHLNSDGSVDASVLASGVLPEGYTLFDEKAEYTVHVSSADNSSWEITKGTEVATTYVTGFNGNDFSNDLTMSGSGYEYTHTTVWFAVKWTVGALNDTVVIDYGLPVNITVLTNDMFGEKGTLNAVGASAPADTTYSPTHNDAFDAQYTTAYGTATANTNSGTVKYTLNSTNCPQSDTFAYEVEYAGETKQYYYATVTVIPATTVYFEESFVTYTDTKYEGTESENGKWTQDGTADTASAATQAQDRPGNFSLSNVDANNIYGYDASYNNMTAMSLGGAKKVTVDKLTGTGATAPIASFTFTGTGFDIISLTNSDSGAITAKVYTLDSDGNKTYKTGLSVCNYYGYTYDETNGWVATPDTEDCIWQVPVLKIDGLDYAKYYVEIKVLYADALNLTGDDCYSFWLDAVRIYDPVDATNDKAANDAYTADGEIAPQYMTLRDLLVSAGDLGSLLGTNGAVFIDGKQETSSITDYANPGPNNETYLAYGQGVAFKLHAESKPTAVHIGVKLAKGSASSIKYTVANDEGKVVTDKQKDITTASDMYYDLGQYITWYEDTDGGYTSGTIVLSNATNNNAVLSITNIKYTGMATASAQSLSAIIDNDVITNGVAVMAMYAPVIVPDPFVPEMLETSWTVGRAGRTSMLTVKTSTDVARLTVNGEELKSVKLPVVTFNRGKLSVSYVRAWVYTVKLELGEHSFDIVAYDENGLTSESVKTEVNVTKKNSFFGK